MDYVKLSLRDLKSTSLGLSEVRGEFKSVTVTNSVTVKSQRRNDPIGFDYALTLTSGLVFGSLFEEGKCAAFRKWVVNRQKSEVMDVLKDKNQLIKGYEVRLHEVGARLDAQELAQMKNIIGRDRSYRSHPNWVEIHRQVDICCLEFGMSKKMAFDILYLRFGSLVGELGLKPLIYKSGRTDSHMQKIFDRGLSNRFLMMNIKDILWSEVRGSLPIDGYLNNSIKTIGVKKIKLR